MHGTRDITADTGNLTSEHIRAQFPGYVPRALSAFEGQIESSHPDATRVRGIAEDWVRTAASGSKLTALLVELTCEKARNMVTDLMEGDRRGASPFAIVEEIRQLIEDAGLDPR